MAKLHQRILEIIEVLGYGSKFNGVCHGFTMKWIEALLLGEQDIFSKRIERLLDDDVLEKITQIQNKEITDDLDLLEIRAFFENIVLYHQPWKYIDLFNVRHSHADMEAISQLASSDKIQAAGGLKSIPYIPMVFHSEEEITNYLTQLQLMTLGSHPMTIGILLSINKSDFGHVIGLSHQISSDYWSLMDINDWPEKKRVSIEYIAERIALNYPSYCVAKASIVITRDANLSCSLEEYLSPKIYNTKYTLKVEKRTKASLLWFAILVGHAELLSKLQDSGVDFNEAMSKDGDTPALFAVREGHISLLSELAQPRYGVDFNKPRNDGLTPAMIAACYGQKQVIAEFIKPEYGINFNISRTSDGVTALYFAAGKGHASIIAEFAKHGGVDFNIPSNNGMTPAMIAAYNGHSSVIGELAKHGGVDFNKLSNDGMTPAMIAAQNGHAAVIAELAKLGVDLNWKNSQGATPASIAAYYGRASIIAELAKSCGIDFNLPINDGATPLFLAAQRGHLSVILELAKLKCKVDFNKPFITTASSLRTFSLAYDDLIKDRIERFISEHKEPLSLSPKDIAHIMGHTDIVAYLSEKESLEDAAASCTLLREPVAAGSAFFKMPKLSTASIKRDEKNDDLDSRARKK